METAVTVKQGTGAYVPSSFGSRESVWQEPVSVVTTHTGCRIVITGDRSKMVASSGTYDVSDDVSAKLISNRDHTAIVEWWHATAARWKREAQEVASEMEAESRGELVIDGHAVTAPGFTSAEQFMAFVDRAKAAQLRTYPGSHPGKVMVQNTKSGSQYEVTRTSCTCKGHQGHGRCYHRALVLWLYDVQGVQVCRIPTIGVDIVGVPMTVGPAPAMEAA